MTEKIKQELVKYCQNWFAKSGKIEDVALHYLVEGIRQAWAHDKQIKIILREKFKEEYYRRLGLLFENEANIKVPLGKLVGIYQLNNINYPLLFAVVKNGNNYAVGTGYDPEKGIWNSGEYNIPTEHIACEIIKEHYKEVNELWHI